MYALSKVSGHTLLIGGYGAGNLGDEAILSGLLNDLSEQLDKLSVISHDPEHTMSVHGSKVPSSIDFNPIKPSIANLGKLFISCDEFVVGGGGIFSKYMGPYASKIPYYVSAALALGKPVHWTAIGVYPSTPDTTFRALKFAMKRSDSVTVRDRVSEQFLRNQVLNVQYVDDPATILKPDHETGKRLLKHLDVSLDQPILGIAARRVLDPENSSALKQAYIKAANRFSEAGWQVVFLPFTQHPTEDVEQDGEVCKSISEMQESWEFLATDDPIAMLSVVNEVDAMVTTRLHSTIFAETVDTPYVAIEYADKCSSFLSEANKSEVGIKLEQVSGDLIISTFYDEYQILENE